MNILTLSSAALLLSLPIAAQAVPVTVTIGDPGAMEVDLDAIGATGAKVETFDTLGTGSFTQYQSDLGTYSAGRVKPVNQYGGADETQYLFSQSSPGTTLTLDDEATYFGLWWSAGSVGNSVELLSDGVSVFVFDTDDVLEFLDTNAANSSAYYGNPNDSYQGKVTHEPFVFLNMFSDTPFDTVVLSGPNFESDNHTLATSFTTQTGTSIAPVPLPASLPLLAMAFGGMASVARRRKNG
ncbi:VPLPA-CTERM sorting domain-containing protein [Dinoroseobacter sp. S124A]|uniref:VPLPA-CTERM sorting domain-containing protein n=1 Tax=Dinoroseobacter sp. S124A TaxID=3415128 RepID=UPI003C7C4CAD